MNSSIVSLSHGSRQDSWSMLTCPPAVSTVSQPLCAAAPSNTIVMHTMTRKEHNTLFDLTDRVCDCRCQHHVGDEVAQEETAVDEYYSLSLLSLSPSSPSSSSSLSPPSPLSVHLSLYLSLSIYLSSTLSLCLCLSVFLLLSLSLFSLCICISVSIYLSVCLSVSQSVCLSVYLSVYLFICLPDSCLSS